jgi:hypothetical protein
MWALDAIINNYPTLAKILGEEILESIASEYVEANPPDSAQLALYGTGFPDFIGSHPVAMALPHLQGVARIDRLCIEAQFSQQAPTLTHADLARVSTDEWSRSRVAFHPATRIAWFPNPAPTIWLAHSKGASGAIVPSWRAEGILVTRIDDTVNGIVIGPSAHRIVHGLRLGETVSQAALAASQLYPEASISSDFDRIVASGALSNLKRKG